MTSGFIVARTLILPTNTCSSIIILSLTACGIRLEGPDSIA
jgi:hypothetical protein